jgi:hypothetical protein
MSDLNPYRPPVETPSGTATAADQPTAAQRPASRHYVPGGQVAQAAVVILAIIAVLAGFGVLAWGLVIAAYLSEVVRPWIYTLANVISAMNIVTSCLRVPLLILFCVWFHRIYANVQYSFQVGGLKYSPVWASGAFFIPIMNLFVPYRIAREIYVGSHAGIHTVTGKRAAAVKSGWVPLWWGLLLAMTATLFLAVRVQRASPFVSDATALLGQLITIAAAAVTIRMIRDIEILQNARATASAPIEGDAIEREEPEDAVVVRCPGCGVAYDPNDYNPDAAHIYCTTCKAELPRQAPGA